MFWQLFAESTITQSILVLLVVGAGIYLAVTGTTVPDWLTQTIMVIVGYFFGSKVTQASQKMRDRARLKMESDR